MKLNKNDTMPKNCENASGIIETEPNLVSGECEDITRVSGKICNKCKTEKQFSEFHKSSKDKYGRKGMCKLCKKEEHHLHYITNKEKYLKQNKKWVSTHKKQLKAYHKHYSFGRKKYFKDYRIKNREKRTQYQRELMSSNMDYRISCQLRHRVNLAVKLQKTTKIDHTSDLLGCTIGYFRNYLESKFQNGMVWNNYGKLGWHIDHIKPCASFNLSNPEEQRKCFHYTNMQPLWAMDNFRKGKS
jgi:hypothetical protein